MVFERLQAVGPLHALVSQFLAAFREIVMQSSLRSKALVGVVSAAVFTLASSSQAAISVFTSLAAFNAATSAQATDTFTGFSITGSTPSPITRAVGPYGYTAAVSTTSFFGGGTTGNPFLSTNTATDTITINTFTGGVTAVGGNFFGSDIAGLYSAGSVTMVATDSSGSVSQTIAPTAILTGSFLGFVSTGPMTSLTISAVQPATGGFLWPSVDNLVLARTVVPEPASMSMLAAAGTALLRRRR